MGNLFPFINCIVLCILYADVILGMDAKGGKWRLYKIEAACRLAAEYLALLTDRDLQEIKERNNKGGIRKS